MDFVRDYMRALLAKEIDAAAELQKQKSQVIYQQYCAGGTMHRGYYCPSLTEDLWLGNTKRGRLCKKRPSEERLSHIYGFDAAERLIVVEHMHCSKEYILYDTGVTLGVEIDNANNASAVNICRYDVNGRIQIYECYFLTPKADQVFYMTRETFRYLPDQVIDNWYREMEYAGEWFHEHQRCVFPAKDGCLGDYTAENFYHGRCGVKIPYRVTKKRKVPPCNPENR